MLSPVHRLFAWQDVDAEIQCQLQDFLQSGHAVRVNASNIGMIDDRHEAVRARDILLRMTLLQ